MSDLEEIFWNSSVEEIQRGYVYNSSLGKFVCLICGEIFEEGVIYPGNNQLLSASKAIEKHILDKHHSVFHSLVNLMKKYTGLSDIQRDLLVDFYEGKSDKEIADKTETSTSTIRNHRFKFKERERQAKILLVLMGFLKQNEPSDYRTREMAAFLKSSENKQGPKYLEGERNMLEKMISNDKYLLITDIGSTTTKALLLEMNGKRLSFKGEVNVPTTVEKPNEDVKIGLFNAVHLLEKNLKVNLTDENGKLSIPFLTTSSAGGGLQIIVFGLTSTETGRLVELAAYGAGAVILQSFAIDDNVPEIIKMKMIRELHPDMILMAGGIDGGGIWGTLRLAQILALSDPEPKFVQNEKIPLIFAGNIKARQMVTSILEEKFNISLTDNLRPSMTETNIEPTRQEIHRIFMENVMERAPGYHDIKSWTISDIIPTPSGVEKILNLFAAETKTNCLMVDIGGATTDIFTSIKGKFSRTVAANTGMSYSISNILKDATYPQIGRHFTKNYSEEKVRDYISNKMLNPTYQPLFRWERVVEMGCAAEGLSLAWKQHKDMHYKAAKVGFLDRIHLKLKYGEIDFYEELFQCVTEEELVFQASEINIIIGAGGVISCSETKEEMLAILTDGFLPLGVTKLMVDKPFKSPHLGILSVIAPDEALKLFNEKALVDVGYVVAPYGKIKAGKEVLQVTNNQTGEEFILRGGELRYFADGCSLVIKAFPNISLGREVGEKTILETDEGVLFDCRGRGDKMLEGSVLNYFLDSGLIADATYDSKVLIGRNEIISGELFIDRRLPYKGQILVESGKKIKADDVIGQNLFNPPKMYLIDVKRIVGYENHLSEDEITKGIMIKIGNMVEKDQPYFRANIGIGGSVVTYRSNVRGLVYKIEKNGMIILTEKQDYDDKPVVVHVAEKLGVKPKEMPKFLKYQVGDFVECGQFLAENTTNAGVSNFLFGKKSEDKQAYDPNEAIRMDKTQIHFVKAPSSGYIKDIDFSQGTVTIQYKTTPMIVKAFVGGEVNQVADNISATIKGNGDLLYGIIGFGNEAIEPLTLFNKQLSDANAGKIVVCFNKINKEFLNEAVRMKVAGIIAPSMESKDWVDFYGHEIGVALTGEEEIPFVLVLTEGFGNAEMNADYQQILKEKQGMMVSLSGRTQIRAGVTRPMIVIS